MNVLFLTLPFSTSKVRSSYEELLRMFINDGHSVYEAIGKFVVLLYAHRQESA